MDNSNNIMDYVSVVGTIAPFVFSVVAIVFNKLRYNMSTSVDEYKRDGDTLYFRILFGELFGSFLFICIGLCATSFLGRNSSMDKIYLAEYVIYSIYSFIIFILAFVIVVLLIQKRHKCKWYVALCAAVVYVLYLSTTIVNFFGSSLAFDVSIAAIMILLMLVQYSGVIDKKRIRKVTYHVHTHIDTELKTERKPKQIKKYTIVYIVENGKLIRIVELHNKDIIKIETIIEDVSEEIVNATDEEVVTV